MRYLLGALLIALFVLAWQGVASLESVDDLTLASPVETFHALRDDWSLLWDNALVTLVEVLLGLAVATLAGVTFAVTMHLFRPCATPPTRCSWPRRRSRWWSWRPFSCSPSTTGWARSSRSWH